jgi:hypothetical protein
MRRTLTSLRINDGAFAFTYIYITLSDPTYHRLSSVYECAHCDQQWASDGNPEISSRKASETSHPITPMRRAHHNATGMM